MPTPASPIKPSRKKKSEKADLKAIQASDHYLIELNGVSYELDDTQYRAIMRKKDMPADRLALWLASYADEKVN